MLENIIGKTVKDVTYGENNLGIQFTDNTVLSAVLEEEAYHKIHLEEESPPTSMAEVKERLEKLFPESEWNIIDGFCIQNAQEGGEITKYIKYNQAMNDYDFWVDADNTVSFLTHPDINLAFQRFVTALHDAGVK